MPVPRVVLWLWLLPLLLLMVAGALVILPAAPALVVRRRLLLPPAALALVGMVGVAPRDEARVLLPAVLSSCAAAACAAGGGGCCGCRRPMPVWSGVGGVVVSGHIVRASASVCQFEMRKGQASACYG